MNGAKYMLYHHDCETSFNLSTYTMSRLIRPDLSADTTDSQTDTESAPTCYGPSSDAPNKEYFMNRINEGSLTSQATAGAEYNIHHTTHVGVREGFVELYPGENLLSTKIWTHIGHKMRGYKKSGGTAGV